MENFQNRLFNYEAEPPEIIWDNIVNELDNGDKRVVQLPGLRKRSKLLFYGLTAAASLVIIFLSSLFFNKGKNENGNMAAVSTNNNDSVAKLQTKDSLNNVALEGIILSSKNNTTPGQKAIGQKKYITIAGPGGQPVKISSKVATLIVSSDNDYPPRPVWNKKINKWKQIMLSSTLSPTATNLLDIAELSSAHGDN
ncbi:MAG: hypothetical protein ABIN25_03840 [Ginsengibacter sp.]